MSVGNELSPDESAALVAALHADPRWPAWKRRFHRHARALDGLVVEMRACGYPHANGYLQEDMLHLCVSATHIGNGEAVQEASAGSEYMPYFGGGTW